MPDGMTLTDWLSATGSLVAGLGSVAAVIVATIGARAAWKQVQHLENQLANQKEDEHRDQASRIASWLVAYDTFEEEKPKQIIALRVANSSNFPVFRLTAVPVLCPSARLTVSVLEPFDGVFELPFHELNEAIESRTTEDADSICAQLQRNQGVLSERDSEFASYIARYDMVNQIAAGGVEIQFHDMRNFGWVRESHGALVSLSPEYPRYNEFREVERKNKIDTDAKSTGIDSFSVVPVTEDMSPPETRTEWTMSPY